jgi:hypothetical protein
MNIDESQTCPRRMEEMGPWEREKGLDFWQLGTSFVKSKNDPDFYSCSFCGSIHPDIFMAKVREGWFVGPTDKNYKAYLGKPLDEPVEMGDPQINQSLRDAGQGDQIMMLTDTDIGKFYYQHLSDEQRQEFVALVNDKTMKIGYPGHFYRLPYFMVYL